MTAPEPGNWFRRLVETGGPQPPATSTLGMRVVSLSADGEFTATFEGRPEFANMLGGIQGGFLAAMLDASLSCALLAALPDGHVAPTLQLNLNYLTVAPVGTLTGRGRVLRRGRSIAFLAGELTDADGTVTTTATATARIVRRD